MERSADSNRPSKQHQQTSDREVELMSRLRKLEGLVKDLSGQVDSETAQSRSPENVENAEPELETSPGIKRKRKPRGMLDTQKCHDCRKAKVKCTPAHRVWPEKCARCEDKGFRCSENTKSKRTRRIERPTTPLQFNTVTDAAQAMVDLGVQHRPEVWSDTALTHCVSVLRLLERAARKHREEMDELRMLFSLPMWSGKPSLEQYSPISAWGGTILSRYPNKLRKFLSGEVLRQLTCQTTTESQKIFLRRLLATIQLPSPLLYERTGAGWRDPCLCGKSCSLGALSYLQVVGEYGEALMLWENNHAHTSGDDLENQVLRYGVLEHDLSRCIATQIPDDIKDDDWLTVMEGSPFLFDQAILGLPFIYRLYTARQAMGRTSEPQDLLGKTLWHIILESFDKAPPDVLLRSDIFHSLEQLGPDEHTICDNIGQTLLHTLCRSGSKELVEICLLKAGSGVNNKTAFGSTPLHYAAAHGDIEICELLIRAGAVVSATDNVGATPLHYAISQRHTPCGQILIYHASISGGLLSKTEGYTPLALAVHTGQTYLAERMLKTFEHQDLNQHTVMDRRETLQDLAGETLYHLAVHSKKPEMVRLLLSTVHDLDIGHRDAQGRTALILAVCSNQLEMVPALLGEVYAIASLVDCVGNSALHYSIKGGHWDIYKILVQRWDCDLSKRNMFGQTPLDLAKLGPNGDIKNHLEIILEKRQEGGWHA